MSTLINKNVIVTGASQGLGLEIARHFIRAGISGLALCARNANLLDKAVLELSAQATPNQRIIAIAADIADDSDAKRVYETSLSKFGRIHILVNNAGVYGPKGRVEEVCMEEWLTALRINLIGPVLMCRLLLPHFREHGLGRIIQLSGGGATTPLPFLTAYAASKAGVVRFMESLAREVEDSGITVNCIAPGLLDTRMLDEILTAGPEKVGREYYDRMSSARRSGATVSPALAAELAVFLASDASQSINGRLISAQWDNWQEWPEHIDELKNSDVYTLRRITGRDRGLDWGDK